jgi:Ca2+-binding RTX toxin-like protein
MPRSLMSSAVALVALTGGLALAAQPADAAYSVNVRNQTLRVTGNGASDRLALRVSADSLQVDVGDNGSADFDVPRDSFERIRVRAGGGSDLVRIDDSGGIFTDDVPTRIEGQGGRDTLRGGRGGERLLGGAGADTVDGNGGDDDADLGAGDDRFVWDPGDGNDVIEGRRGVDTLTFNGSGVGERFDLSANGPRARFFRNVGNITMDLDGVERVGVASLGGSDALTVGNLRATDVRTVDHDEAAALGASTPDAAADQTIVNAAIAGDTIAAAGSAGSANVTGLAATVNVAHAEPTRDALTLNALGADDSVSAQGLGADTMRLTVDAGAGNDTVAGARAADTLLGGDGNDTIDGNGGDDVALMGAGDDRFVWDPGDGSNVVEGQAGSDAMTFNGSGVSEQFDVSANGQRVRFLRNVANIVMDLDDVERLDVNALGGADALTVNGLSGTDLTGVRSDLAGDGQPDTVTAVASNGADAISVAGSAGNATVSGLAARVEIAGAEPSQDRLSINALAGDDVVDASGLAASAIGLNANGRDGEDVLIGSAGADTLLGAAGDDVLIGGPGVDVLDGGAGDNTVIQD